MEEKILIKKYIYLAVLSLMTYWLAHNVVHTLNETFYVIGFFGLIIALMNSSLAIFFIFMMIFKIDEELEKEKLC